MKLKKSNHFKYLGVTIDNTLNWNQQIENTLKQHQLYRTIGNSIPKKLFKSVYYSFGYDCLVIGYKNKIKKITNN